MKTKTRSKKVSRREAQWRKAWSQRKRRLKKRLARQQTMASDTPQGEQGDEPVIQGGNVYFAMAERQSGTAYGGVIIVHQFVEELGLAELIDARLELLKCHKPYHESDHVLNFAYNAMCDGDCLEDMELRRHDEAYLNGLNALRTPDPTTAGDFCRRFTEADIYTLLDVYDEVRLKVWSRQADSFFDEAIIDMDGTLVETSAEKMEGIDISYNGIWGYHPLVVSLANTGEILSIVNRSGNRPSHEGAAAEADRSIALCRRAGFRRIRLRGDTDFTQTVHLDRWDEEGVIFVFGCDARIPLQIEADDLPESSWQKLDRPARYTVNTTPRAQRDDEKERIINERNFANVRLISEEVAEMEYQPSACRKSYRLIIVRKNLERNDGQGRLFEDYRYFFYLTNDRESTAAEIVFSANDRCHQENLLAQLKSGVCSLTTPVHTLLSNWAYMVMTSLAWNLKAWMALWPNTRGSRPTQVAARGEQQRVLRMEFKTFVNQLMRLPAIVTRTGRRIVVRFLSWTPLQPVVFRLWEAIRPQRC